MEDLVLKWVQVCVGRGDLIKATEREGHKWFESADRLPSTLLKCTATFFLLPSHQSGDCLSLISHLSLQPFATCSFLLGDQAETRHSWISVNLHNDVPVHTFSMKQSDVDRHKRCDCDDVFISFFCLPFCLTWTKVFVYSPLQNKVLSQTELNHTELLFVMMRVFVFRNRGK